MKILITIEKEKQHNQHMQR